MAIVDAMRLDQDSWWLHGVVNFGRRAGRMMESDLRTVTTGKTPYIGPRGGRHTTRCPAAWADIARAELARREALEA